MLPAEVRGELIPIIITKRCVVKRPEMAEDFRRLRVSRLPFSFGMIYLSHKRTYTNYLGLQYTCSLQQVAVSGQGLDCLIGVTAKDHPGLLSQAR